MSGNDDTSSFAVVFIVFISLRGIAGKKLKPHLFFFRSGLSNSLLSRFYEFAAARFSFYMRDFFQKKNNSFYKTKFFQFTAVN